MGGDGFSAQVLHTGDVAILHGCRAIRDALTLDSAVCVNVTDKGSTGPRNGAVCVNVTQCRDVARRSYGAAGYRSVAHGSTLTVGYCFAGDSCRRSNIPIFIHSEGSTGAFDGTVRCNDGIVLAHFDSIFAEGNLVFAIFIQYQFFHSLGAIVFNLENLTVTINFEIILVGRFARSCFSLDLPIQVSIFSA